MPNVPSNDRIGGFDVARAIAIFGMIVHHFVMAMDGHRDEPSWLKYPMVLLDGRPAVLFLILAGIGITLRSRKACHANDAQKIAQERITLSRRGLLLLILGYLNLLIWPGDILRVYGVSLLIAAWLFTATNRQLLTVATLFPLGFGLLICSLDYEQNWDWSTMTYHGLWTLSGSIRNLFFDGFRSVFPFSGFIFFGMWLGRLDLQDPAMNRRVMSFSVGVTLCAEAVSAFLVHLLSNDSQLSTEDAAMINAFFGTESMPPFPLFLAAAGGTAVATIAVCVRLADSSTLRFLTSALEPTGRMALTWYFAHIYLGLGTIVALGAIGNQSPLMGIATGVVFFMLAAVLSWLWSRAVGPGPLESVLRYLCG